MNNNGFYTKENLKLVVNIFKDYMTEKYDITLEGPEEEATTRKVLFNIMSEVQEECKNKPTSLQNMNIRVLNAAKELFVRKYDLGEKSKKPNIQNLSRDKQVFGNRQMNTNVIVPEMDPYTRRNVENKEQLVERLMFERDRDLGIDKKPVPDVEKVIKPTMEKAENADDFIKRLKDLESQRNMVVTDLEAKRPKTIEEQQVIQQNIVLDRMQVSKEMHDNNNLAQLDPKHVMSKIHIQDDMPTKMALDEVYAKFTEGKETTVIPRNFKSTVMEKYLSINSFDRNWMTDTKRYQYSINFLTWSNSIQNRYRNIESICVTKVVIPDEIVQIIDPIQASFNHEFTFSYPYLLLQIDEFNDIYDGTNDNVRKSFCKLAFDKAYKGQNGRGYVVLEPIQNERKIFYPAPLSTLNKLSISLLKPNGTLFNESNDAYNVLKIEYDGAKPKFLKVTCDSYFDKNEFFVMDTVIFKNFVMTKLSVMQQEIDIKAFNEYINQNNGFEIVEVGAANPNGYFNTFYIQAPGQFNRSIGQFQPNMNLINCLNSYNSQILTPTANGSIMNFSLQHTISMKVNVIVDDARIIDTQSSFNF